MSNDSIITFCNNSNIIKEESNIQNYINDLRILIIVPSPTIRMVYSKILSENCFNCENTDIQENIRKKLVDSYEEGKPFAGIVIDWIDSSDTSINIINQILEHDQLKGIAILIMIEKYTQKAFELAYQRDNCDLLLKTEQDFIALRMKKLLFSLRNVFYNSYVSDDYIHDKETILLVDDSMTVCITYSKILKDAGYKVITAQSINEALIKARQYKPSLAIVDYYMPDGNGDELCRQLNNDPKTRDTAVVMFSNRKDIIQKVLEVGAIDLIYKDDPFNIFMLRIRAIMQVIKSQRKTRQLDILLAATHELGIGVLLKKGNKLEPYNPHIYEFSKICGGLNFFDIEDDECIFYSDKNDLTKVFQINRLKISNTDNIILVQEITERKLAEDALRQAHNELEIKVKERTVNLYEANKSLKEEIKIRHKIEAELQDLLKQLKETQLKMIQTEKMSALGTMIAGIAHELNNPMMGMLNYVQYCIKHTNDNNKTYNILKDTEYEINRCIKIVRNLLTFSHFDKSQEQFSKNNLKQIIDRVLRLFKYRLEKDQINVEMNIPDKILEIDCHVSGIQQVFLNLFGNAIDAMNNNSIKKICISIANYEQNVIIEIKDTGSGISEKNMEKIFDPFFTTKPVGKGTGMGLSLSHSIIKAHKGDIKCNSKIGQGTTFIITLPITQMEIENE